MAGSSELTAGPWAESDPSAIPWLTGAMVRGSRAAQLSPLAIAWLAGFALPLLESPTVTDPVFPARFVVLVALVCLGLASRRTGTLPRPVGLALIACLAVFVVAAVVSATPVMALLGRYPRYEGLPVVAMYAGLVWIGAGAFAGDDPAPRRHFAAALAASTLVQALVALVQVSTTPDARVTGLLGNSTTLGTWGVITLGVLAWELTQRRTWLTMGGVGAALLLVALSASRGAQVAVLGGCAVALLVRLRARQRPNWWIAPALAAITIATVLLTPTARARVTGLAPFAESTITGRLLLWEETLRLLATTPVLGVGPSRFVDSIGLFHTERWAAAVGPYAPPDSPHNVVLQVAASAGVLGVLAVLAVVVAAGVVLWRAGQLTAFQCGAVTACAAAAVAYAFSFTDPTTTSVACLLLGGALGKPRTQELEVPVRRRPAIAMVAIAGLVVAASLWRSEATYGSVVSGPVAAPEAKLSQAVGQRAWDPDLRRRVGYTMVRLVEGGSVPPDAALRFTTGLCDPLPGSIECLLVRADAQDLAGDSAGALATLDSALDLEPTNVDTHLKIGIAHAGARDYEASEQAFLGAVRLRPSAVEPWDDLAQLYRLQGREADAAAAAAKAEALRPHR